jgi:hypothetical protein
MTESFSLNLNPRTYEDKYEGDLELSTILFNRFNDLKKEIKVMLPCQVTKVNHDGNYVTVEILDYDSDEVGNAQEFPPLTNVPIRQCMDSSSAYIRLPVQIGDIGTIEFFDSSVDDLVTSNVHTYDLTEDWHKLSDNLFTNGFLPKDKLFTFDSNSKLALGTKTNKIYIKFNSNDEIEILAEKVNISTKEATIISTTKVNITTPNINVTGNISATGTITGTTDVIGSGKSLKTHTHPYTDDGANMNTGAPN